VKGLGVSAIVAECDLRILMMRAEYDLAQSQCCDTQQTMERNLDLDQHTAMPAEVYFSCVLGA
jgi:hypothetical protein